jgi:hypothetical protein
VTRLRRLITWKVGFAVLGGIACLVAIAAIVIAVALQRAVDKAMAHAVIGGLAECDAHAKATGIDSHGFPKGPVTVAFVSARPDANLVYPGATVLKRSSSPEVFLCGLYFSRSPAKTEIEFSTPDPAATVNRWYEAHLGAEGWQECAEYLHMPEYRSQTIRVFHRGDREGYTVDHFVPVYPSPPPGNLFTVSYSIDPYTNLPPPWTGNCTLVSPVPS